MTAHSTASTALLTDRYELTMLQATLRDGTAQRSCVFELFARRLSGGRRYGVIAGVGRLLDALESFRFGEAELAWLREAEVVDEDTIAWLADYSFSGSIWGYPEGEIYFPYSPVLIVEGTFAECVILETLFLSILNHDSAIASAAARMVSAAGERPCIEMGSRRTHELVGRCRGARGVRLGLRRHLQPRGGSYVRHPDDRHERALVHAAARHRARCVRGADPRARHRHHAAGRHLRHPGGRRAGGRGRRYGARRRTPRLRRPGLARQDRTQAARRDSAPTSTRITVTSDLDEHAIAALASAPVDGYGVGTALVTGSGVPTSSFVYKLVARVGEDGEMVSVAKASKDKISVGGRKYALRRHDKRASRRPRSSASAASRRGPGRSLLVELVRDGKRIHDEPLDAARDD